MIRILVNNCWILSEDTGPGSTSILNTRVLPTLYAIESTSIYAWTYLGERFFPTRS